MSEINRMLIVVFVIGVIVLIVSHVVAALT